LLFVQILTPVINLKANKSLDPQKPKAKPIIATNPVTITTLHQNLEKGYFDDWQGIEYDPSIPNEYEKIIKERREKDKERRDSRKDDRKRHKLSGFGGRQNLSDEEEEFKPAASNRSGGAMIAPPPSLQDFTAGNSSNGSNSMAQISGYGSSSVAQKIMAKYGFKDGQGLGKQEQGMSVALQVEKTSKRGGRIIHEKELISGNESPPFEMPAPVTNPMPPPAMVPAVTSPEPSITEMMKSPSKVVLLRNMVGPEGVDDELKEEVRDECNTKYGDVISIIIKELPNKPSEEAVRIFVEFKRIESAIKAVVDLNGRYFGGRQVRAGFYSQDKYENLMLYD
jgi:splicing factor 45